VLTILSFTIGPPTRPQVPLIVKNVKSTGSKVKWDKPTNEKYYELNIDIILYDTP